MINRLSDGRFCPACAERTLDALPSLLPRVAEEQPESASALSVVRERRPEDELGPA